MAFEIIFLKSMFWGQIIGNDRNCRDEKSTFSKLVLTLKFFKFFLWKSRPSLNCWLSDDYFTCILSFWLLRPICLWICKIWWKSLTSMYGNFRDYLSLKGNLEFATPWITLPSSHPIRSPPPGTPSSPLQQPSPTSTFFTSPGTPSSSVIQSMANSKSPIKIR